MSAFIGLALCLAIGAALVQLHDEETSGGRVFWGVMLAFCAAAFVLNMVRP